MITTLTAKLRASIYARVQARSDGNSHWADYSSCALELGFLIRNNGLACTLAFLANASKPGRGDLVADLWGLEGAPWSAFPDGSPPAQFAQEVSNLTEMKYLRATQFALTAAEWFKRSVERFNSPGTVPTAVDAPQNPAQAVTPTLSDSIAGGVGLAPNVRAERIRNRTLSNPGQLLAYGYDGSSTPVADLLMKVAEIGVSCEYKAAYARWLGYVESNHMAFCNATLRDRAFLGIGCADVLETHVQLHAVFGVPFISGETLKGLAHAHAEQLKDDGKLSEEQVQWLFGAPPQGADSGASGNLEFHDAWWIPEGNLKPLVLEIDTPHHGGYYKTEGKTAATDYDDPIPVPHLAVKGSFLVAISGDSMGAQIALNIAAKALSMAGVGARKNAGYGAVSVVMQAHPTPGNTQIAQA